MKWLYYNILEPLWTCLVLAIFGIPLVILAVLIGWLDRNEDDVMCKPNKQTGLLKSWKS